MPSLIYGDACTTSSYDANDGNMGEILIKHNNKGAIGYIGALRVTWYVTNDYDLELMNRGNARFFWREFFEEKTIEDALETRIEEEKQENQFEKIGSINDKISQLLIENNITTLQDLNNLVIKDLIKIKGIRKKTAKKIKQEVKKELEKTQGTVAEKFDYDENPYIKEEGIEEDEWQSFDEEEISNGKVSAEEGFR